METVKTESEVKHGLQHSGIVIQLNAAALIKLIEISGGDEFVLKLQQAAISNVIRGRSKALVGATLSRALEAEIAKQLNASVGTYNVREGWKLTPELSTRIKTEAESAAHGASSAAWLDIEAYIRKVIAEKLEVFKATIESVVEKRFEYGISTLVDKEVKRRIELALKG